MTTLGTPLSPSATRVLLLGSGESGFAHVIRPFAWGFALWGAALYWWAALLYIEQYRRLRQQHRREVPA